MNLALNIMWVKMRWKCRQHMITVMFAKGKCAFVTVQIISVEFH